MTSNGMTYLQGFMKIYHLVHYRWRETMKCTAL